MRGEVATAMLRVLLAGLLGAGCGAQECAGHAERFCPCSPGLVGTQTCNAEGVFDRCECRLPDGGLREGGPIPRRCGDSFCDSSETPASCPADCGAVCGDAVCGFSESALSCPSDCPVVCGDGACSPSETVSSCPGDCPVLCGDGRCDPPETPATCGDCGTTCAAALLWAEGISEPGHSAGPPGIAELDGVTWIAWHDTGGDPVASTVQLLRRDGRADVRGAIATDVLEPAAVAVAAAPLHARIAVAWNDRGAGRVSVRVFDPAREIAVGEDVTAVAIGDVAVLGTDLGFTLAWSELDAVVIHHLDVTGSRGVEERIPAAPEAGPALVDHIGTVAVGWVEAGMGARVAFLSTGMTEVTGVVEPGARAGSRPALVTNFDSLILYAETDADFISAVSVAPSGFSKLFVENLPGGTRLGQPAVFLHPRTGGALVFGADLGAGTLDLFVRELESSGAHLREPAVRLTTSAEDDLHPALAIEPGSGLLSIAYNDVIGGVAGVSLLGVDLCR